MLIGLQLIYNMKSSAHNLLTNQTVSGNVQYCVKYDVRISPRLLGIYMSDMVRKASTGVVRSPMRASR